jgi:hypothetical protein
MIKVMKTPPRKEKNSRQSREYRCAAVECLVSNKTKPPNTIRINPCQSECKSVQLSAGSRLFDKKENIAVV